VTCRWLLDKHAWCSFRIIKVVRVPVASTYPGCSKRAHRCSFCACGRGRCETSARTVSMPPIPPIPPIASMSSRSSAAAPSCSSSSTHRLKSVFKNGVLSFSFVMQGQYSKAFSPLQSVRNKERDVRRLTEHYWMYAHQTHQLLLNEW
jgi:hypothetical protein